MKFLGQNFYVLFQKRVRGFHLMEARGGRPIAFIVFECLETLRKPNARVFKIASQSRLRNKGK